MGISVTATLFYGYLQPEKDRALFLEQCAYDCDFETPWSATHTKRIARCMGGMYGYTEHLGFYLAVEESIKEAEWETIVELQTRDFKIHQYWQAYLETAAQHFHLNISGLRPSWYLTSLYF